MSDVEENGMTRSVSLSYDNILQHPGPFTDPDYEYEVGKSELGNANVLVIGAGGLGCEILKDLALSGVKKISVIDMDTIEVTNLNRQFLFRQGDVGQSKALVASRVVAKRVPGVTITPYFAKIQDFGDDFYTKYSLVVCGLDSIEARRWINSKLVHLAVDNDVIIPMIDGGTEGFQGSVKLIIPTLTACFECYKSLIPAKVTYPLCTLAATPRLPEHCIEWAHQLEWQRVYPQLAFDADTLDHVNKMYELARARAEEYGIAGVTKSKTLGVVKNIIPAIASTNAIISAQCCNEAFKFLTSCNPSMKDTLYYNGESGVLCETDDFYKIPDCGVCGIKIEDLDLRDSRAYENITLQALSELLKEKYQLHQPVLMVDGKELYNFKYVQDTSHTNGRCARDILGENSCITIVDKNIKNILQIRIML